MRIVFHFSHSTPGKLICISSVCSVYLYRSFATNLLFPIPISYIGSGFFETWCRLVNKDSLLFLKQITFTLLLAFHRSTRNVPCIPPPNRTIGMHSSMFTLDTPFELMTILSLTDFLHKGFRHFCVSVCV